MPNSRKSSTLMYGLLGISMGALVGAGYSYRKKSETQSLAILNKNMGATCPVLETPPDFQISREVSVFVFRVCVSRNGYAAMYRWP
jgi:predicted acylesterase/phospholipase RssA